jgi:hypothetical protein
MAESEQMLVRSYLDALSDHEKVNEEAISAARHKLMRRGFAQRVARDCGSDVTYCSGDNALHEVMIRWHNSLVRVLGAWEDVLLRDLAEDLDHPSVVPDWPK